MSEGGDVAVLHVQNSSSSTSTHLLCVLNVEVVPEPHLRRQAFLGHPVEPRKVPHGMGMYFDRNEPPAGTQSRKGWWDVYDEASAAAAVGNMIDQLDAGGWARLDSLLEPGGLLAAVQSGDLGFAKRTEATVTHFARAEALLLMDAGPSDALDDALDVLRLAQGRTEAETRAQSEYVAWVHAQSVAGR